jgi:hypothetical protein
MSPPIKTESDVHTAREAIFGQEKAAAGNSQATVPMSAWAPGLLRVCNPLKRFNISSHIIRRAIMTRVQ